MVGLEVKAIIQSKALEDRSTSGFSAAVRSRLSSALQSPLFTRCQCSLRSSLKTERFYSSEETCALASVQFSSNIRHRWWKQPVELENAGHQPETDRDRSMNEPICWDGLSKQPSFEQPTKPYVCNGDYCSVIASRRESC
ncbi:hypothetical protein RRG08_007918 [Elysia crispata]|uniref:Uncharacterized protein n=1 Tax=Elysia crispata TaxID=231223 RepID=A0AAE1DJW0_9GAST|nr:hypothetical protein RRG08_007918 [Elysia crispata]